MVKTKSDFSSFFAQLHPTNLRLADLVDFKKVEANTSKIEIYLRNLDFLLGKANLEDAVQMLWNEYPQAFSALDILVAVRSTPSLLVLGEKGEEVCFTSYFESPQDILSFLRETGLDAFFQKAKVNSLVDYVFGVEVGLDTNARKNRGGKMMEETVSKIFTLYGIPFSQEVYSDALEGLEVLGEDIKRFDFMISTKRTTYLIETNFYKSNGSKLNEVARAYSELSPKINSTSAYEFVWITDGQGWNGARNKLEEAFYAIPHIYNLTTLPIWLEKIKQEL